MNVILSPKEKERFQAMSEPERQIFMQDKADKLEKLSIKTAVLTMLLVESLDEIEMYNLFRHKLKKTSKMYKSELESYMNELFKTDTLTDNEERRVNTSDFIMHSSKAVDEEVEKVLTLLMQ
jgi:hypothetical protein